MEMTDVINTAIRFLFSQRIHRYSVYDDNDPGVLIKYWNIYYYKQRNLYF